MSTGSAKSDSPPPEAPFQSSSNSSPPTVSFMKRSFATRDHTDHTSKFQTSTDRTPASGMTRTSSLTQSSYMGTGTTPATLVARSSHSPGRRIGNHNDGMPQSPHRSSQSLHSAKLESELVSLASFTIDRLDLIWDEIGIEQNEREMQLKELFRSLEVSCNEKIEFEQDVAKQYRQSIVELRVEVESLCTSLQRQDMLERLSYHTVDGRPLPLTEQLQELESALNELRDEAAEATNDLSKLRDDINELFTALEGHTPSDDMWWLDVMSDLTKERREKCRLYLAELQDKVRKRSRKVVKTILQCKALLSDLLVTERDDQKYEGDEDLPEGVRNIYLTDLDNKVLQSLKAAEYSDSDAKEKKRSSSSFEMESIMETSTCVGISNSALEAIIHRVEVLLTEKQQRKQRLAFLGNQIAILWEKLKIPQDEQHAFVQSVTQGHLSVSVVDQGAKELRRLQEMKEAMLGGLVSETRDRIMQLWEETNAGEAERKEFSPFFLSDETKFSDELLRRHEEYIVSLEHKLETMQPILTSIAKREEILRQRQELEDFQKDPSRLQGRSAAKQLAKEEKMEKRIKKDLPKLTKILERDCKKWKVDHGNDFLYHGEVYLDVMEREEEDWLDHKHGTAKAKQLKKQKEREYDSSSFGLAGIENNRSRGSSFAPPALPGVKKDLSALQRQGSRETSKPFGNAMSRSNSATSVASNRHPSRGKVRPESRPKSRPKTRPN